MREIVLSLFIVAAVLSACQQKEEPKPLAQFPTGPVQPLDEGKLLREAVQKDPKNVDAWIKLGNLLMDTGRYLDAAEAYGNALELDPKNVDVRVDMATCYKYAGKPETAVKEFRKALEINPRHLNGHRNLAVTLANDTKDIPGAIKEFEKVLELAPNAPDAELVRKEIERLKGLKSQK